MHEDAKSLRIAVATEEDRGLDGRVGGHFGRCPGYAIVEMREGAVTSHRIVANPHRETHVPGAVPEFLAGLGADVVLAGGMGPRAVQWFHSLGIEVMTGVDGSVAEALAAWTGGARGVVPCQHDHPSSCGGHGAGGQEGGRA